MCPSRQSRKPTPEPAQRFFHRDISWLEFNRRVLAQAGDPATPLLERVRFLAIFTSNLDEFFMKRVGLIKRQVHAGLDVRLARRPHAPPATGRHPGDGGGADHRAGAAV